MECHGAADGGNATNSDESRIADVNDDIDDVRRILRERHAIALARASKRAPEVAATTTSVAASASASATESSASPVKRARTNIVTLASLAEEEEALAPAPAAEPPPPPPETLALRFPAPAQPAPGNVRVVYEPLSVARRNSAASSTISDVFYDFLVHERLVNRFNTYIDSIPASRNGTASALRPFSSQAEARSALTNGEPHSKPAPAPAPAPPRLPIQTMRDPSASPRRVPRPRAHPLVPQPQPQPPPTPPSEREFAAVLEKLRAPITGVFSRDEAPWDAVEVCGHTIHRFLCQNRGPDGEVHEIVGFVSAELAALLGERRLDEMRAEMLRGGAGAGASAAAGDLKVDGRIFTSLQRAGVGMERARTRTRGDTERAIAAAAPLTELSIALTLVRLRKFRVVTLSKERPAPSYSP